MSGTWAAVLGSCAVAYGLKASGYVVPQRLLDKPLVRAAAALFPVALLSALLGLQTLISRGDFHIDARVPALAAAAVALRLRWPFLAVVGVAAAVAALLRAVGWMP